MANKYSVLMSSRLASKKVSGYIFAGSAKK
jgi:hypothetical protein